MASKAAPAERLPLEPESARLIVFGGLPGVGKTSISHAAAIELAATYLRIDAIEQAIRDAGIKCIGSCGYAVAQTIATANLRAGRTVVADYVDPVAASRDGWVRAADEAGARLFEVEVICSDVAEHERRIRTRVADIAGHVPPEWEAVSRHEYEPRVRSRLIIDTAELSVPEAVAFLVDVAF